MSNHSKSDGSPSILFPCPFSLFNHSLPQDCCCICYRTVFVFFFTALSSSIKWDKLVSCYIPPTWLVGEDVSFLYFTSACPSAVKRQRISLNTPTASFLVLIWHEQRSSRARPSTAWSTEQWGLRSGSLGLAWWKVSRVSKKVIKHVFTDWPTQKTSTTFQAQWFL